MITAKSCEANYKTLFTNGVHEGISDTNGDKGGGGSGFRPHDLLEAALASCMNIWLRMYARDHDISLSSATVRVELDRGVPDQAAFRYFIDLKGNLTIAEREELLYAVKKCPVHETLSRKICFEAAGK